MSSTQRPSATNTFLATPRDALLLLEAVRRELLPRTTRRLTRSERDALVQDGAVFVWEERETQMQRWTDGKRWSCSRVMGEFLGYEQVLPGEITPGMRTNSHSSRIEGGLIKQTFSTTLSEDSGPPKKYHIIAYHRSHTLDSLQRPSSQAFYADMDLSRWRSTASVSRVSSPSSSAGRPQHRHLDTERPSLERNSASSSSLSAWGVSRHSPPQVCVVGPSRRGSVASDFAGRRRSLEPERRAPAPYHASSVDYRHQAASDVPPPPHPGYDQRPAEYHDIHAADRRYHPYRPSYGSAPSTSYGPPSARRMISPTPSLVSDSTNDSSRCSSPKTASSSSLLSCDSAHAVVGTTSSRGVSGTRLWPPPRPSPVVRDTPSRSVSLPLVELILPHPSLSAAKTAFDDRSAARSAFDDRPADNQPWRSSTSTFSMPSYRSALATEDERMLSRLSFRI